jgi:NAD(P)H-dependent flavin oxidoreductase YrpB (nitropropane dioxygenase family)
MADDGLLNTDPIRTRVSELLGVRYPIVQAPMGWIARSQLASAVSNAGGLGIIETSSGELDAVMSARHIEGALPHFH